ncbi:MAG: glycosyltransferase family 2 protein [Acidobacteria bacterium]|nr:glycosyltransferase family 2 protein [Acidobacteriota bacterium]
MIFIYLPFAALLVYFSIKSFQGGLEYLEYFKQELAKPVSDHTPLATVIVPCKGLDEGLRENLEAVMAQSYPLYEVVFVVDDANDRAMGAIREVAREGAVSTKAIVAPLAVESGQKVENLREAVLHADERSEVFVFVDSDVGPAKDWLRALVAAVEDKSVGAATGYRWFVAEETDLATELRSAWNASIASALGPDTGSNFCWGGSTAMRREVFERLDIRDKWRGTLSDDFVVTRILKEAGLPIWFVPRAIVASAGRCSAAGLFEFTNRQMKITRVYARDLWLKSFFGSGLFNLVMAASILIVAFSPIGKVLWVSGLFTLICVAMLSIGKAWLRLRAIRLVLSFAAVERQLASQMILTLFTPLIFLVNCFAALFSATITWRGTEYTMISSSVTKLRRH